MVEFDFIATKKNPVVKFSQNILKQVVGVEKAQNAFNSISMASIPSSGKANANLSLDCKFGLFNIFT
jgi:hypothetical protein